MTRGFSNRHEAVRHEVAGDAPPGEARDRPRVLITNFHPGVGGGHDTYLENVLGSELSSLYEIHAASPPGSRLARLVRAHELPHHGCDLQINPRRPVRLKRSIARFLEILRVVEPQLVHTNAGHDTWIAALARWISGSTYGIVRTHHTSDPIEDSLLNRWLYGHEVHANLFVTHAQFEEVTRRPFFRPANWEVVPNGIDLDRNRPRPPDDRIYGRLGLDPSDFVFGSVAGTGAHKRVDVALRALRELGDATDVRVCVLGKDSTADRLQRLARDLGVEDRYVHAGFQEDVRPYVALFDLGFVLSDRESCSLATREMMAMGVPVVSTDFAASRKNIEDGTDGFIVPTDSPGEVARAIRRVRAMPAHERTALSRRARLKAVGRFGLERQERGLIQAWNRTLAEVVLPPPIGSP